MSVTCYNSGRMGNIVFHQSMMMAYAKKWDLEYYTPNNADAYKSHGGHNRNPFSYIPSTGARPINPRQFEESNIHTEPSYQEIPKLDGNTIFIGYYQSFLYFDWCRDYILEKFNLPNNPIDCTSINVRRGDCIQSKNFPVAPISYYQNAVKYMQSKGFNKFKVFSDDQIWCKTHFNNTNFPEAEFVFSEGISEMDDYIQVKNCINNITARSTFSLTASWMNENPNKIVCVPSVRHKWWAGQNKDMLTGTNFIQIDFENAYDEWWYKR